MLKGKSLTDLRVIAQSYGIGGIFEKDKIHLLQAIEQKQKTLIPEVKVEIPQNQYDPRIMTKIPARKSDKALIEEVLAPYVARGLKLTFPEPETWAMSFGKKADTGTMRMPPRVLLGCASKVME